MNAAISDETLHAFIDGELDVAECEQLLARMRDDEALSRRACALRSLKSMVRLAYAKPPAAVRAAPAMPKPRLLQRCAYACLVLLAGLSSGWALRGLEAQVATTAPATLPGGYQMVSLGGEPDPSRVMLHLDSSAPERMLTALDQAERLLDEAEREGRAMQVEIVANSHGIDLMRAGVSPYAARMAQMTQRHANLQWVACSQTIARFTSQGQKVELLPTARAAPTAIGEIVTRLQQGWTYVRV
jgi:intracellular sulfur oxidation DsrE/DsrF family protein